MRPRVNCTIISSEDQSRVGVILVLFNLLFMMNGSLVDIVMENLKCLFKEFNLKPFCNFDLKTGIFQYISQLSAFFLLWTSVSLLIPGPPN